MTLFHFRCEIFCLVFVESRERHFWAFQDEEFDEEFDPDKHDKKMQEIFNDQYYQVDESDQKPEFPFDEEIDDGLLYSSTCSTNILKSTFIYLLENWDEYTGGTGDYDEAGPSTSTFEPHCEDPDFNVNSVLFSFFFFFIDAYADLMHNLDGLRLRFPREHP